MRAYITRLSFPSDLDGLYSRFDSNPDIDEYRTDIDSVLAGEDLYWSLPKSVLGNDIVFFQATLSSVRNFNKTYLDAEDMDDEAALDYLDSTEEMINDLAGHLIAVGKIAGRPEYLPEQPDDTHFKQRNFAPVINITPFSSPLKVVTPSSLSRLPEFSAHGPVANRTFQSDKSYQLVLGALLKSGNVLPGYLKNTNIRPVNNGKPLSKHNWKDYVTDPDVSFALEAHLRQRFSDYLLKEMSDRGKLLEEVEVLQSGKKTGVVDNVIFIEGIAIPVECKLNIASEQSFGTQVAKYTGPSRLIKGKNEIDVNHTILLAIDNAGAYILDNSEFFRCSPKKPFLHREEISNITIAQLKGAIKDLIRI